MEADIAYIFSKKVVKIDLWLVVAFYCLFLRMKLSTNNFVLDLEEVKCRDSPYV